VIAILVVADTLPMLAVRLEFPSLTLVTTPATPPNRPKSDAKTGKPFTFATGGLAVDQVVDKW
jgi:hypothetical protein